MYFWKEGRNEGILPAAFIHLPAAFLIIAKL
jgi:hypothetical protein